METNPFGALIRDARAEWGLTQVELARRVGVRRSRIATIETRLPGPLEPKWFNRLQQILGFDPVAGLAALGYQVTNPRGAEVSSDVLFLLHRLGTDKQRAIYRILVEIEELTRMAEREVSDDQT